MGNRAVISFADPGPNSPVIYLHWNGGLASVRAFLLAAKDLGLDPTDRTAFLDRWAEILAEHFFGSPVGTNVYRETYGTADKDNGDNGLYIIDRHLSVIGLKFAPMWWREEHNAEKTAGIRREIVAAYRKERANPYYVRHHYV